MERNKKTFSKIISSQFKALGTFIDVQIVVGKEKDIAKAEKDIKEIKKKYSRLEKIFSRFDKGSELSNLNKHLDNFFPVSDEMKKIIFYALKFHNETKGFFDPRIIGALERVGYDRDFKDIFSSKIYSGRQEFFTPSSKLRSDIILKNGKASFLARMDFSGIAKGYITDIIAEFLSEKGWKNFLVDSGGDMYFSGQDEEKNIWTVDIEGAPKNKILLGLSNKGIATSGITRRKWEKNGKRFHHLINPKAPEVFSFDLKSVTVIAPTATSADVWAKTLFLMGKNQARKYAQAKNLPCAILDYKGNIWISPSIKKYLC
jgi:FAD:protein FMN transferase